MDSIFLSGIPDSKGLNTIQKLYSSDTLLGTSLFNQYVLLKISEDAKILCKLVPQPISTVAFATCDSSVINHLPNKLIDPRTVKFELSIDKGNIEPISVRVAKRIIVSVIFNDVEQQSVWSTKPTKLTKAVRNLLRLFVVHNNCIVSLKRLGSKQNLNIQFILVHKTDCENNGAHINAETSVMIIKTMSTIQFSHAEIGLVVQPLFGMEPQVSSLKNIIKAARNGFNSLCNMVLVYHSK